MEEGEIVKNPCNRCKGETNQKIVFQRMKDDTSITKEIYRVLQCQGCDEYSFSRGFMFEEEMEDFYWYYYPEPYYADQSDLLDYEVTDYFPAMIGRLYSEVGEAFKSESSVLAGIGLRTLIEAICIQQGIKGKNLKEKIENLQTKGLISKTEAPILDKLRLIGNFSAHQIKSISLDKLHYALDIINHVLKSIYFLPKLDKRIKI